MKNLVVDGFRYASIWSIGHHELAADFCSSPTEGKLFVATSNGQVVCFACETLKVCVLSMCGSKLQHFKNMGLLEIRYRRNGESRSFPLV